MSGSLDLKLLRLLRTAGHSPRAERAVAGFSRLGEHGGLWLAIAATGAAADSERRAGYRRAGMTVAASFGANQLVKLLVRRHRPRLEGLAPLVRTHSQLSYPSAHATTSVAGARSLSGLLPAGPLGALAAAMALSRLYLGVHYPTDTLAGAALGLAIAELAR